MGGGVLPTVASLGGKPGQMEDGCEAHVGGVCVGGSLPRLLVPPTPRHGALVTEPGEARGAP